MSILDIIIFLFFTGGVVVFGCSFFNKKRSSEEFTSAGRSPVSYTHLPIATYTSDRRTKLRASQ